MFKNYLKMKKEIEVLRRRINKLEGQLKHVARLNEMALEEPEESGMDRMFLQVMYDDFERYLKEDKL